jgi:squalene-associated FAD-dependent desaturase
VTTLAVSVDRRNGADGAANPRRVVIVGGGLAGIAAALDCAQAGASVTLLERRARLGGAAYSFARNGMQVDNGQHVFLRCCSAYRGLLSQLGAHDCVTLQRRLAIPVLAPGGRSAWLRRSSLPAPLHLAGALARYGFLTLGERVGVGRAMRDLGRVDVDDPAADAQSFGAWLREHRQSPAAQETIWRLIARATLNLDLDEASLAQAAQVFQTALLQSPSAGDIGYAHEPLSAIHDVRARAALERAGVDVRLRWRAAAIAPARDGGFEVETSAAPTLVADAVIVAVPPDAAASLLPAAAGTDRARFVGLGRSAIVNVHLLYDRRVLELPFAAGVHSPVQYVFDRTASSGTTAGQYLAISLSAADAECAMTIEELRKRYVEALAELLPAARGAHLEGFFVTREHAATFRAAPGARALRPGPRTGLPGLVLAGSWTDTGWPATMEGAVRSGHEAAREALAALTARAVRPAAVVAA